ncbi:MAG TPA: ATP-binding protein, partial [Gemmatimonadaceae bacterium]|nr:ATP-binding protein [Gemmatimonadaceae bacterium]
HRLATISVIAALIIALALGAFIASRIAKPVRQLSDAATALGRGEFDAQLPTSRIIEVASVAGQFNEMRRSLERRLGELHDANAALADRNARLVTLQADLMQRDRLSAGARLVGQLAHEIRNPVANLRNLLELIRRLSVANPAVAEYAEIAIAELLRMHSLAEQMLDLNRPRNAAATTCNPRSIVRDVVKLAEAGLADDERLDIRVHGPDTARAAIAPDALKQVLVNLIQNAREAIAQAGDVSAPAIDIELRRDGDAIVVAVSDNGPGVPPELRERVFDPFVTTKAALAGVGLGLFVAEGLVRSAGGRLTVHEASSGGALFRIDLRTASVIDDADEVNEMALAGI